MKGNITHLGDYFEILNIRLLKLIILNMNL
uniref:Uncharacterized protein n=1 Tax=Tetranychus urticae TaxID=32264 RepID=T1KXI3_TETUR